MMCTTTTSPLAITQGDCFVSGAAYRTQLCGREPSIDAVYDYARFLSHVVQDTDEAGETQVRYFATPQALHAAKIQVFKVDGVVGIAQFGCKSPVVRIPAVGDALVDTGEVLVRLLTILRALEFMRKFLVGTGDVTLALFKKLRRVKPATIAASDIGLEAEIEPDAFTCQGPVWFLILIEAGKEQVDVTKCIALDGECFDVTDDFTRLGKLVDVLTDANTVVTKQAISRLLKRERFGLSDLAKSWDADVLGGFPLFTRFGIGKEPLIGAVDTLNDILNRLGAKLVPKSIPGQPFQLGDMSLKVGCRQVFAKHTVVATMQRDAMIMDDTANINLLMQSPILFTSIQLEGKRFASHLRALLILDILLHHFKAYCSDCRDKLTSRPKARKTFFSQGYSLRRTWDVYPLIFPTIETMPTCGSASKSKWT